MSYFPSKKKLEIGNISQVKSSVARGIKSTAARVHGAPAPPGLFNNVWPAHQQQVSSGGKRRAANTAPSFFPLLAAASICEQYPYLEETGVIDVLIPKKEPVYVGKCEGHVQVVTINNVPLFFQGRDAPWCPTLRILHQYPEMMKRLRADQGAIKFVLSGANIMCPGLTSPGATIHDEQQMQLQKSKAAAKVVKLCANATCAQ
eukprot:1133652-Pelagomonas_calceolata.AAC.3